MLVGVGPADWVAEAGVVAAASAWDVPRIWGMPYQMATLIRTPTTATPVIASRRVPFTPGTLLDR
ncbi:hypothetical protein [Fodinicola feengrottensis]|uniref:hypothetical protein n=1 Tax=Fodinicola feengrottensis TaxID=435914 RepID=UPI002441E537|nr:hypothetical protein [Fodinicola feengrottensis]